MLDNRDGRGGTPTPLVVAQEGSQKIQEWGMPPSPLHVESKDYSRSNPATNSWELSSGTQHAPQ